MAFARVVEFEGVDADRMQEMQKEIEGDGGPPEGVAATEILVLHDLEAAKAMVVIFFDTEEDYDQADEVLGAMPTDETPGRRSSVTRYRVAARMRSGA
ncbi:MAG TPA: hypothetical protein VGC78_04865 [Gaiellaceae bacterium]|jgi:hypothetical protein